VLLYYNGFSGEYRNKFIYGVFTWQNREEDEKSEAKKDAPDGKSEIK